MRNCPFRRKIVLLLLGAVLATPWAAVAGSRPDSPRKEAVAPVVTESLGSLWKLLVRVWAETGCHIDPNGACHSGASEEPAPASQVDEGCHIDPSGACRS